MKRALLTRIGFAAIAVPLATSACTTNRCTEFHIDALSVGGELGVGD